MFGGSGIDPGKELLYGRTGRFWTLGASIGCLIPLGKGFCTEVSVRMGYRSTFDGKKYRYDQIDDQELSGNALFIHRLYDWGEGEPGVSVSD